MHLPSLFKILFIVGAEAQRPVYPLLGGHRLTEKGFLLQICPDHLPILGFRGVVSEVDLGQLLLAQPHKTGAPFLFLIGYQGGDLLPEKLASWCIFVVIVIIITTNNNYHYYFYRYRYHH